VSKNRLERAKNRRTTNTYSAKPHHIFRADLKAGKASPASILSSNAFRVLDNLLCQYNGKNNGDLAASPKIMKFYGWSSTGTVHDCIQELISAGFIQKTRQGARTNKCSLFAVTWLPINECNNKLDVKETTTPSNFWKEENRYLRDQTVIKKYKERKISKTHGKSK